MGPYALFQADRHGAGIRPRPYSRNMATQPYDSSIKTGGWLDGVARAPARPRSRLGGRPLGRHVGPVDKYGFNPNVYGAWGSGGTTVRSSTSPTA